MGLTVCLSIALTACAAAVYAVKCLREMFPSAGKHLGALSSFFAAPWRAARGGIRGLLRRARERVSPLDANITLLVRIVLVLAATRAVMYAAAYIGYVCFGGRQTGFFTAFESIWNRCDSPRYLQIAEFGYLGEGAYNDLINIAFYPLYPLMIRACLWIFGSYFYSALFVSFISLAAACFFFYKLVLLDHDAALAERTLKYFLIYPFSLFLSAAYTESLFMALSLACVYCARRKKWLVCGILGMLASFCRAQGPLLLTLVAYEIIAELPTTRKWRRSYLGALLIPCGTAAYLCLNKAVTGDWFRFMDYQTNYWLHGFAMFYDALGETMGYAGGGGMRSLVNWIPQILMFFAAVALPLVCHKRIRTSYLLYALAFTLFSYSNTLLVSGPRYVIGAFPLFMAAAMLTEKKLADRFVTMLCLSYQTILVVCFAFDKNIL